MGTLLNELLVFIKKPFWGESPVSYIQKWKKVLFALLIYLMFTIMVGLCLALMNVITKKYFGTDPFLIHNHNSQEFIKRYGKSALLIIILFAPILEETLFRLWLGLNKITVSISFAFIFLRIVRTINDQAFYSIKFLSIEILLSVSVGLLLFFLIKENALILLRNKYFKLLYYFSAISFGLVHIYNFHPINYTIFFVYPFFVLPQLGLGFMLGLIRTKYGFGWGILLHILINLLASTSQIIKLFH